MRQTVIIVIKHCDKALEETVGKLYGVAEPSDTQVSNVVDGELNVDLRDPSIVVANHQL